MTFVRACRLDSNTWLTSELK